MINFVISSVDNYGTSFNGKVCFLSNLWFFSIYGQIV